MHGRLRSTNIHLIKTSVAKWGISACIVRTCLLVEYGVQVFVIDYSMWPSNDSRPGAFWIGGPEQGASAHGSPRHPPHQWHMAGMIE